VFEGIEHIISPMSAPWCGWVMAGLLLCALMSEWFQPGIITQAHESLLANTDRTYKQSPNTFLGQLLIALFRIGTLAMALCLCVYEGNHFSMTVFGAVCGLAVVVLLIKMLSNIAIDYTFRLSQHFGNASEIYADLSTLATLLLYPVVLVMLRLNDPVVTQWGVGIVALIFLGMWIYRSIRLYLVSPQAAVYLMLYIGTLEVLPLAVLYVGSAKLIAFI